MYLSLGSGVVAQAESCMKLVIYSVPSSTRISCSCFSGIFKLNSLSIFSLEAVESVFFCEGRVVAVCR